MYIKSFIKDMASKENTYFISSENLFRFLDSLKEAYDVYVPVKKGEQRFYRKYDKPANDIVFGEVRAFEPLKAFFSRAREIVSSGFSKDIPDTIKKPLCIVGVKACDLKGFKVQDLVFKDHDFEDPFYSKLREQNLIISTDCTSAIKTCFCLALEGKPYAQDNFDINLSEVSEGFIVETGSEKGQDLINKNSSLFKNAGAEKLNQRSAIRHKTTDSVEGNIKENKIPDQKSYKGIVENKFDSDIWKDEAKACVECGACNAICPTCHCFLLYDQKDEKGLTRLKLWDSCMVKDFARVAGGANPRPKLWMRLRNRFEKKFDYFPKVANIYACTGCGRCISACPAKIDIRKVLKRLVGNA